MRFHYSFDVFRGHLLLQLLTAVLQTFLVRPLQGLHGGARLEVPHGADRLLQLRQGALLRALHAHGLHLPVLGDLVRAWNAVGAVGGAKMKVQFSGGSRVSGR